MDTITDLIDVSEQTLAKLRELREAQLALIWPAAEQAAANSDHAPLVELIKVYTAIQAIDFAIANRPDLNAATRVARRLRSPPTRNVSGAWVRQVRQARLTTVFGVPLLRQEQTRARLQNPTIAPLHPTWEGMSRVKPITRAAGLARLAGFGPAAGGRYASSRNTDRGAEEEPSTSLLSPYMRRRLLTEPDVIAAAVDAHGRRGAERFVESWSGAAT